MKQITDEILAAAEKPMRYTGGEWNSAVAPDAACSFALTMPDVYEVGMSNLGLAILYEALKEADVRVERVYAPWPDMEKQFVAAKIFIFAGKQNPAEEF